MDIIVGLPLSKLKSPRILLEEVLDGQFKCQIVKVFPIEVLSGNRFHKSISFYVVLQCRHLICEPCLSCHGLFHYLQSYFAQ